MTPPRYCENCGSRMQPRWPRKKTNGLMMCPTCVLTTQRTSSAQDSQDYSHEERPQWHEWGPTHTVGRHPYEEQKPPQPRSYPDLDREFPGRWPYRPLNDDRGEQVMNFDPHREAPQPMHTMSRRVAVRMAQQTLPSDATDDQRLAHFVVADLPPIVRMAHDSGSPEVVFHCFSGDTRYLTRDGVKTLAETAGTVQEIMTSAHVGEVHSGSWVPAMIHEFGVQRLWSVTLQRNKVTKVIRATAEHRWLITAGHRREQHRIVPTHELRADMRLPHLRLPSVSVEPDHEGIRMGFVFGDGTIQHRVNQTYGMVNLWGAKRDVAKYFEEICLTSSREVVTDNGVPGLQYTSGMAGYTKTLPPLTAPLEYLRGWLMGYFAADGSVTGTNVNVSSASLDALLHVRDVCTLLGIGTYTPTAKWRTGYGKEKTLLHLVGFSAKDLDSTFFLRDDQRAAFVVKSHERERFGWTVVSAEETEREETVYCPRVPGTESFVLEDNIWTANCPFCGSGQVIARSDGSISCEFCASAFTVQVQPEFSAFPQTIDGQPVDMPGPGLGPNPNVPPGQEPPDPNAAPSGTEQQPPEEGDPDGQTDEPVDSGGSPIFNKSSSRESFRTAAGAVLSEPDYVRHLALQVAPDREALLARMRREAKSRQQGTTRQCKTE